MNIKRSQFSHRRNLYGSNISIYNEQVENMINSTLNATFDLDNPTNSKLEMNDEIEDQYNHVYTIQSNEIDKEIDIEIDKELNKENIVHHTQIIYENASNNENKNVKYLMNNKQMSLQPLINNRIPFQEISIKNTTMNTSNNTFNNTSNSSSYSSSRKLLDYFILLKNLSEMYLNDLDTLLTKQRKVLHLSFQIPKVSWKMEYFKREEANSILETEFKSINEKQSHELERIQNEYKEIQFKYESLIQQNETLNTSLQESMRDYEGMKQEKLQLEQALHQADSQITHLTQLTQFYLNKKNETLSIQCDILSIESFEKLKHKLMLIENIERTHVETNTIQVKMVDASIQEKPKNIHFGAYCVSKSKSKAIQCIENEKEDKAIDQHISIEEREVECHILDLETILKTEMSLREEIDQLVNRKKTHQSIECDLDSQYRMECIQNNTKSSQIIFETIDESVECIPECIESQMQTFIEFQDQCIQMFPEMQDQISQIVPKSKDKEMNFKPETSHSRLQYNSSNTDFSHQYFPEILSKSCNTLCNSINTEEKGTVCFVFSEEIGSQCNILTLPQEFSQDYSTPEELRVVKKSKKSKNQHSSGSSNGSSNVGTIGSSGSSARKRKSNKKYCDLCNIKFGSNDELQLHQEACHTKRRKTEEESTNEECDICMLELFDGKPMYRLRACQHYFHIHCIYRCLLSRSIPNRCVRCFSDITDLEKDRIIKLVKKIGDSKDDFTIYEFEE